MTLSVLFAPILVKIDLQLLTKQQFLVQWIFSKVPIKVWSYWQTRCKYIKYLLMFFHLLLFTGVLKRFTKILTKIHIHPTHFVGTLLLFYVCDTFCCIFQIRPLRFFWNVTSTTFSGHDRNCFWKLRLFFTVGEVPIEDLKTKSCHIFPQHE